MFLVQLNVGTSVLNLYSPNTWFNVEFENAGPDKWNQIRDLHFS